MYLLGQSPSWHNSVSVSSPTQKSPPLAGKGVSQALVLVTTPAPQVTEQGDQGDQPHHPPFIGGLSSAVITTVFFLCVCERERERERERGDLSNIQLTRTSQR